MAGDVACEKKEKREKEMKNKKIIIYEWTEGNMMWPIQNTSWV